MLIARVRAFVKRREDEVLRWESLPDEVSDVSDGWHPAVAVQDQAAVWAQKWRANSTPDHAAIDAILESVPRLSLANCHLVSLLTASARPCASCGIKWAASMTGPLVPSCACHSRGGREADLWTSILKLGRVPRLWKDGRVALLWKTRKRTRPITACLGSWRSL